ncbi:MAG: ribonuclease R [Bacteroidetes bacterium]|nr:ribonuclease R [Bacteroidota bacterium]
MKLNKRKLPANFTTLLKAALLKAFNKHPFKPFNYKQLAKLINQMDEEMAMILFDDRPDEDVLRNHIQAQLTELVNEKTIEEVIRGKYRLVPKTIYVEGRIEITSNGSAYVMNEDYEKDIYIAPRYTLNALNNDTVKVSLFARRSGHRSEGEVIEVIKRARTEFAGVVQIVSKHAFLVPDGNKATVDIFILPHKLNGAKHGDKAVVRMTEWRKDMHNPAGEILQVLGRPGENNAEMQAILVENGFPLAFPEEVEAEAENIPIEISKEEIARRRDFRKITTFTIDPVDAKDFDDALSIEKLENGNYSIGIHIADVSHYVINDSALDKEAYDRATSIYLVDRVIPMLPEKLSNNVCSLRPKEEKLCFSAVFEMDIHGKLLNEWFGRTIIFSDHRFTYEDAQVMLENKKGLFADELKTLDTIAKAMRKDRFAHGSINFDKTEVKFKLDEVGYPIGVYLKEMKDSNHLIEEFMLLANKRVATFVGKFGANYYLNDKSADAKQQHPHTKTFVYRIHDVPDPDKIKQFAQFAARFGYKLDLQTEKNLSKSINKLMQEISGKPEQNMLETLAIRSMAKAKYSTENIGHYGLGFEFYSHFTSPIRRYPDVLAHRLLQHYLDNGKSEKANWYEQACKHASLKEVNATEAERTSIKYKQVQFLENHIGDTFDGVISGVSEWGMFIELTESMCEGLIRLRDLADDYYELDEKSYCIRGTRKGKKYRLGDSIKVVVKKTDLERRQIEFGLYDEFEQSVRMPTSAKPLATKKYKKR